MERLLFLAQGSTYVNLQAVVLRRFDRTRYILVSSLFLRSLLLFQCTLQNRISSMTLTGHRSHIILLNFNK